jgi:hypothetical protein
MPALTTLAGLDRPVSAPQLALLLDLLCRESLFFASCVIAAAPYFLLFYILCN